ncbi:MAG: trypsin-like peptidase domain-containing protein [Clostridia bacterium]|nr:trypsin-like peptidase domain-containing protein [Clostridia bacterium]
MEHMIKKSLVILLTAALLFAVIALPVSAKNDPIKEARAGVVKIYIEVTFTISDITATFPWVVGSGSLIATDKKGTSSDLVLTCYHVIDDTFVAEDFAAYFGYDESYYAFFAPFEGMSMADIPYISTEYYVLLENDVKVGFTLDKNAYSVESDWAILHLDQKLNNIHAMKLGTSSALEVNDEVWALGFPALVETSSQTYTKEDVIVTKGIISKLDADNPLFKGNFLMHDALLTGGNSGGPLVDKNGNIIGINSSGYDAGYYYATRIDDVRTILDQFGIVYVAADGGIAPWVIIVIAAAVLLCAAVIVIVAVSGKNKKNAVAAASAAQPTSPTLHIVVQSGRLAGSRYRLTDRIAIGRDPSRCHIVFPADTPGVSGLHCELFVQNGAVYLRDCNSSYGTYLANGTKLAGGNIVMVGVGTTFFVGERDNSFTVQY